MGGLRWRTEPHAVHADLVADGDGVRRRVDQAVPLRQVVLHRALVKHAEDDAVQLGAELVVLRLVRETAWLEHADDAALHVLERVPHPPPRPGLTPATRHLRPRRPRVTAVSKRLRP